MDGSTPPQSSRVPATPVLEHIGDEKDGDTDNDAPPPHAPPPRKKPSAASNPKPRASATQVKSSVSKPNAIANSQKKPSSLGEPGNEGRRSRSQTQTIIAAAAALTTSQMGNKQSGSGAGIPRSASLPPSVVDQPKNKAAKKASGSGAGTPRSASLPPPPSSIKPILTASSRREKSYQIRLQEKRQQQRSEEGGGQQALGLCSQSTQNAVRGLQWWICLQSWQTEAPLQSMRR